MAQISAAAIVFAGSFALITNSRPQPLLLSRARRIADITNWMARVPKQPETTRYFWISDRRLIRFGGNWPRYFQAILLDTHTGQETPLPIRASVWSFGTTMFAISPDRKYLLYVEESRANQRRHFRFAISALDGSRKTKWPTTLRLRNPVWLPDSRRWTARLLQRGVDKQVLLDSQNPTIVSELALASVNASSYKFGFSSDGRALAIDEPALRSPIHGARTVHPQRGGVGFAFNSPQHAIVPAFELDLEAGGRTVRTRRIPAPTRGDRFTLVLSPQGDRLAWLIRGEQGSLVEFLRRWLPQMIPPPEIREELWITALDGGNPQMIGYIKQTSNSLRTINPPSPTSLEWKPDGRGVSIIHDLTLWEVPLD